MGTRRTSMSTPTSTTRTTMSTRSLLAAALAALLLVPPAAAAQDYPAKPIRVIVPYAAGGGVDILARLVGQQLSERFKQPVVVENQGGGSNTIGMRNVAAAP